MLLTINMAAAQRRCKPGEWELRMLVPVANVRRDDRSAFQPIKLILDTGTGEDAVAVVHMNDREARSFALRLLETLAL